LALVHRRCGELIARNGCATLPGYTRCELTRKTTTSRKLEDCDV